MPVDPQHPDETIPAAAVKAAARLLGGTVVRTPLLPLQAPGAAPETAPAVLLKAENLQRTGSFKARGAFYCIKRLSPDQRRNGVVAASAGNHAQGVALAAAQAGVPALIVMPTTAPMIKVEATRAYGAEVVLAGDSFDQAYEEACRLRDQRDAYFVHAFDDPHVITGQGTVGVEILADLDDVDLIVVPVGGGGLISGIAAYVKQVRPSVRVVGVQAEGAPSLYQSLQAGRLVYSRQVHTIADGLAIKEPRERTFRLIRRYVDDMVLVGEDEIAAAILMLLERSKLVVEGAGAVAVAALQAGRVRPGPGRTVAVISGGNIDVNFISRIIERGLVSDGRYVRLVTQMPDRPGSLHRLLGVVAREGGNVITVSHERLDPSVPLGETEIGLIVETRDRSHADALIEAIRNAGMACSERR
ncbi:MAG TPA: threonine ammonia-lyase [Bacillota bacterium]